MKNAFTTLTALILLAAPSLTSARAPYDSIPDRFKPLHFEYDVAPQYLDPTFEGSDTEEVVVEDAEEYRSQEAEPTRSTTSDVDWPSWIGRVDL